MRATDMRAIGELAGDALAAGGGLVQDMHAGMASRPFRILGPAAAPVRVVHDGIAGAVYGGVRGVLRTAPRAGAAVLARRAGEDAPAPAPSPAPPASVALAVVNGVFGDHLARRGSALAVPMAIRRAGQDVEPTVHALASAFPDATPRIAVFVHGLFGDEDAWRGDRAGRPTYGERLQDDLGFTPLHVRYNTGLHVSHNGRALAGLLAALAAAWPVAVEHVVLVGHSMGGLVLRSACHYGEREQHAWTGAVRHVFSLGSPHLGADLEKGLNVLGWALGRLPETRALGGLVNARSAGIKDLRYGACLDEDWCDGDPDEVLRDRCCEVPFLPKAHYHFVAARVADGPVGTLLGDLLVRIPSASGRGRGGGRRIPFEVANGLELTGTGHMALLNHPAVYEQLRSGIARAG